MTAAFALGQILGPLAVAFLVQAAGGFSAALLLASGLLALSTLVLSRPASGGAFR